MTGMGYWTNQTVLITGATGSFGRAAIPALLAAGARRVVLYSRDELKQGEVLAAHAGQPVDGFLGDVRDQDRLAWAMRAGIDVVIHAAALKQVPSCQYNWSEAVETNIVGSQHVFKAAIAADVRRVIALSTDKAAAPLNLYGKSKAVMEEMAVWANAWVGRGQTRLACARYGNILGSRGSVVPLFQAQRAGGVITITDPSMSRFWMGLDEAVAFVLTSIAQMAGGEIFVPRLAASTMADLAAAVAPGCRQRVTGRRPGEKQHEVLISADEVANTHDLGDRFVIYPNAPTWPLERRGVPVPIDFEYSSATAPAADLSMVAA